MFSKRTAEHEAHSLTLRPIDHKIVPHVLAFDWSCADAAGKRCADIERDPSRWRVVDNERATGRCDCADPSQKSIAASNQIENNSLLIAETGGFPCKKAKRESPWPIGVTTGLS